MQMGNIEKNEDVCLLDSATTHTILYGKHFSRVLHCIRKMSTIVEIIDDFRNATIVIPNDTTLHFEDALMSYRSKRNLQIGRAHV